MQNNLIKMCFSKKVSFVLVLLFIIICGILEVTIPKIIADILSNGVAQRNIAVVYKKIFAILICAGFMSAFSYCAGVFLAIVKSDFEKKLRNELFERCHVDDEKKLTNGKIVTILTSDVDKVSDIFIFTVDFIYKPGVMTLLSFIMLFFIDRNVGQCFVIFFLLQLILTNLLSKKLQPKFIKVQVTVDKINNNIQEILENIKFIKISCLQKHETDKFDVINKSRYNEKIGVLKKISYFNPVVVFVMNLALVLTIIILGNRNDWGLIESGKIIMLISYAEQIVLSIVAVCHGVQQFSEYKASFERIKEIFNKNPKVNVQTPSQEQIERITFENVSCTANGKQLFGNLNFTLNKGQRIAVMGYTGCGKTLFSRLFSCTCKPDSGMVKINDNDIADSLVTYADRVAHVTADNGIFSLSIYDNIALGKPSLSIKDVEHIIDIVKLDDFVDAQKYKLKTLLSSNGATISGGEKQKISLARALASNPDVLIIDNSTSSIDYLSEMLILENIIENMSDMIIVFITQRNKSLRNAVEKLHFAEQKVFACE